jgi:hypothetical protein
MPAISSEVRLAQLLDDVEACGQAALELFEQMLNNGETMEFAAMCACQQAPGTKNTDRAFCEGQRERVSSMPEVNRRLIEQRLKKKGFEPGNKFHVSGLGPVDDPTAWVSCAEDVLTIAKEKNLELSGAINRKMVEKDRKPKDIPLADDLVVKIGQKYIQADPGLKEKCRKSKKARMELKERIIATHGKGARKHK